jgi:hypothetical protein
VHSKSGFKTVLLAQNQTGADTIPVGLVWGVGMALLGVILFALRLRYESLSPAWLAHALFNAQLTMFYPLTVWLAPAFYPLIAWLVPAF